MLKAIEQQIDRLRQLRTLDVRTIDIDMITLGKGSYAESMPGVQSRILLNKEDILFQFEADAASYIRRLVFSDSKIHILSCMDAGFESGWHRHPQSEDITLVSGNCTIIVDGQEKKLSIGSSINIPAFVPHSVFTHERSLMIISAY